MKKFTALLLALILILSLSLAAFADELTAEETTADVQLKKLYTITGATNSSETSNESAVVYPHETLTFVSEANSANPTTQNLTIADLEVEGTNGTMTITLPAYTEVGKYIYTVKETAGSAQGAVYATGEITLTVLVTYNEAHTALESKLYLTQATAGDGTQTSEIPVENGTVAKVDTFVNTYDVGQLKVTKLVEGNLASQTEEFEMTVTFNSANPVLSDITYVDGSTGTVETIPYGEGWTSKTVPINVRHDETVIFHNIPAGVTYVVEENAEKHGVGDSFDPNSDANTDYDIGYDGNETGTIASNTASSTTITNTKETTVSTGIALDSMPYILILILAAAGMVAVLGKKRSEV